MSRHGGGDDLEDDFVPDDLVALSDEDDIPETDDIGGLLSADEDGAGPSQVGQSKSAAALEKKRKRRAKEKERKANVRMLLRRPVPRHHILTHTHFPAEQKAKLAETVEAVEPPSVAAQPPVMLADYISSMQAKTFAKMSGIELADMQIPGDYRTRSLTRCVLSVNA